jgi:2-haloacid dehalogenase
MGLTGIKAIVFDVYGTLFNVHSVIEKCNEFFPGRGQEISSLWRTKQLEYSFIRQMIGRYRPFYEMTQESLRYTCELLGGHSYRINGTGITGSLFNPCSV